MHGSPLTHKFAKGWQTVILGHDVSPNAAYHGGYHMLCDRGIRLILIGLLSTMSKINIKDIIKVSFILLPVSFNHTFALYQRHECMFFMCFMPA